MEIYNKNGMFNAELHLILHKKEQCTMEMSSRYTILSSKTYSWENWLVATNKQQC